MKYVLGNWKMNMSGEDVTNWVDKWENLDQDLTLYEHVTAIIAPSYIHIPFLYEKVPLAGQDVSENEKGTYTGDVAAYQLKDFCEYCIVGHSEREEELELVLKKAKQCLENNITPVICFTDPSKADKYYIDGAFLAWEDPDNIAQAGEYNAKDSSDVSTGFETINSLLPSDAVVLYGGSVNKDNIAELKDIKGLSGVLPGTASLDAEHFAALCDGIR